MSTGNPKFGILHKSGGGIMYSIFEELLKQWGVSAYRVAQATGISSASLTDWKKGRSTPKLDKLQKIADYFGVSVDYLCGREKKMDPVPEGGVSDEEIKFALFGGRGPEITDEMFEEVRRFAYMVKLREQENRRKPKKKEE